MILQDDRSKEQKETHSIIIMGTDRCLSGWGEARGGPSYAGWACRPKDARKVEGWVRSRSDMMRVRTVFGGYKPPRGAGHVHIYVVDEGHPALA